MAHTYTQVFYHLIWSTKERYPLILPDFQEELYRYIGGVFRSRESKCIEIGGVADHVHVLASIPTKHSVSEVVKTVKERSSKWIRVAEKPSKGPFWQEGYGAFSVSKSNMDAVVKYIRNQEEHHKEISFRDEFLKILNAHGVNYDEKFLWK